MLPGLRDRKGAGPERKREERIKYMRKRSRPFVKQAYAAMTLMLSVMASAGCGSGVEQDKPLNQTEMTDKAGAEDNRTESGSKKLLSGGESGDTEKAWQQEPGRTEAGGEDRETSEAESVSGESGTDRGGTKGFRAGGLGAP